MESIHLNTTLSGRYVIGQKIGKGSYTEVYEAKDRMLNRTVAVKTVKSELKGDASILNRFRTISRATARIQHPNVIPVFDIDETTPYLIMPLVEAGDLVACRRRRQQQRKPFVAAEIVQILYSLAHALLTVHRKGFIHANLSPRNVLLVNGAVPIVTDIALDRTKSTVLQKSMAASETFFYLSPEQWEGKDLKPSTDQYSLSLVFYFLLSGKHPPRTPRHGNEVKNLIEPKLFLACAPPFARKLSALLQRCLNIDESARFTSMLSIISEIDNLREKALRGAERRMKKTPQAANDAMPEAPPNAFSSEEQRSRQTAGAMILETSRPKDDERKPEPLPHAAAAGHSRMTDSAASEEELLNNAKQLIRDKKYEKAIDALHAIKAEGTQSFTIQRLEREAVKRLRYRKKVDALIQESLAELKAGNPEKAEQKLFSALQLDRNNERVKHLLEKVKGIRAKKAAAPGAPMGDQTMMGSPPAAEPIIPAADATQVIKIPALTPRKRTSFMVSVKIAPPLRLFLQEQD